MMCCQNHFPEPGANIDDTTFSCAKGRLSAKSFQINRNDIMAANLPHKRTKTTVQTVSDLLSCGVPVSRISSVLKIHEHSLRRHYPDLINAAGLKRGQKRFEPTPLQQKLAKQLAGVGTPQAEIAGFLRISRTTLATHLAHELKMGQLEANLQVGGNLFRMATGPADRQTTVTAAIWWSKARMDWKDSSCLETTGADGGAIQVEAQVVIVPDNGRSDLRL
jgi:hypothetical protein